MDAVEKNLYCFYSFLEKSNEARLFSCKSFKIISAQKGFWPQMIFDIDFQKGTKVILNEIDTYSLKLDAPLFFVAGKSFLNENHSELLNQHRIFPLALWHGMELELNKVGKPAGDVVGNITRILDPVLITEATGIINRDMMANLPLPDGLLPVLCRFPDFRLYGFTIGGKLVSAMVVFCSGETAGLYFVVTARQSRNKGYATLLLKTVLYFLSDEGFYNVVLHSEKNAFEMYKKAGFIFKSDFVIYGKRK